MAFGSYTALSSETTLQNLKTSFQGLSSNEAAQRAALEGPNEICSNEIGPWKLFLRQLRSPFNYLLIGAAVLSLLVGEPIDGGLILLFICINTLLGFSQEYHSSKALKYLKQFVVARGRVRRDGHDQIIASRDLVRGDIILLEAGDIVPADARLLDAQALTIDESPLTGESVQVNKTSQALSKSAEQIFEAKNIVFSGTTVASGGGAAVVVATGIHTVLGTISNLTRDTHHESSFEKGIGRFSVFILKLVSFTLAGVFFAHVIFRRDQVNPIEILLFSIALAVSVIPEALPIVTTISLSKGALRLAKNKVVVKRLSAIEDLGSIEVLCTDKTGTITENRLSVAEVHAHEPVNARRYATLASSCIGETKYTSNNAFDIALWQTWSEREKQDLRTVVCKNDIPFDPTRRRNSALIQEGKTHVLILRGAPEVIFERCLLSLADRTEMLAWYKKQGSEGRRVLAVATKAMGDAETYTLSQEEHGFTFQGLVAFEDPIKSSTRQAIQDAQILGIHVKILTGDGPEVAGAVARHIGLLTKTDKIVTGAEFESLSSTERAETVRTHSVFARVSPEQKHAIIQELKQQFEVGFLGEGINDAPALKAANVGIVVQGASDVAREAADIILLQQSLEVIVGGIREGREVFANTLKYIRGTLAANFGNFYAVALSSFFITELPMLPLQILLVNLLSDFPMVAIATDTVDMQELRRPRSYQVHEIIKLATVLGLVSTTFDFGFFASFFRSAPAVLQTNWFMGSILTELAFIYSIRTQLPFWRARMPSLPILGLTAFATIVTITLPYTSFGQTIFHFIPPSKNHLLIIFGLTLTFFISSEAAKLGYHRYRQRYASV